MPAWLFLLAGYVVARILSTGFLAGIWALTHNSSIAHFDDRINDNSFAGFLSAWDAAWYRALALHGYPSELPLTPSGDVAYNTWAFFPVFPWIVRGVMAVTGLEFLAASIAVAVICGALATLALHRMLIQHFAPQQALAGALFFAFGPLSFLLQLGYAEGLFLFLMFCALAALVSRHYLVMLPFALVASVTRPGAIALAAALGIQGIVRLARRQRILPSEWIIVGSTIVLITAATLMWPILAAQVTGNPNAYFETELSWWRDFIGPVAFVPFTPTFLFYGGIFGWAGVAVVVAVVLAVAFWLTRPSTRRLGVDIWTYTVMYIVYLLAVLLPTQSLLRMLLPLSPLLGHPGLSATPRRRKLTFWIGLGLQPVAIFWLWAVFPP